MQRYLACHLLRSLQRPSRSLERPSRSFASLSFRPRGAKLRPAGSQSETTFPFGGKPSSLGFTLNSTADSSIHDVQPPGVYGFVLRALGYYSKEAKMIRGTRTLYGQIVDRAEDEQFYQALKLEKNFRSTYAILALHVWLSLVRFRSEDDGMEAGQLLYDLFYHDVEKRVVAAGVKVLISKWMKELEKNFYGAGSAYDKALSPDASPDDLSRALWRNVFAEDASEMPEGEVSEPVQALARYVRREIKSLSLTDSTSFMRGEIRFSSDYGDV